MRKKAVAILLVFCVLCTVAPQVYADSTKNAIDGAREYYAQRITDLSDLTSNWWNITALKNAGVDFSDTKWKLPVWEKENFENTTMSILDYVHYIFAGKALGYNPRDLEGINLLDELAAKQENGAIGKVINFHIWAMIALDSFGESYDAQEAVLYLLSQQGADGGFSLYSGASSDTDITGMALLALSSHKDREDVMTAICSACTFLKKMQVSSGGFGNYQNGENCNSTAIAIMGAVAAGENIFSSEWQKNDKNPLDGLMSYELSSKMFKYLPQDEDTKINLIASCQALNALSDIDAGKSTLINIGKQNMPIITPSATVTPLPSATAPINNSTPSPTDNPILEPTALPTSNPGMTGGSIVQKSCYLTVAGDKAMGNIVKHIKVVLHEGNTVYDALKNQVSGVVVSGSGEGLYVKSINGLAEFDRGPVSGWKYTVNGVEPQVSAGEYILHDGDELIWFYFGEQSQTSSETEDTQTKQSSATPTPIPSLIPTATMNPYNESEEYAFKDEMEISSWAKDFFDKAKAYGLIKGDGNGNANPKAQLMRAEMIAMFVRLEKIEVSTQAENPFIDVTMDKWYYEDVRKAYSFGIIKGKSNTEFKPEEGINRQEIAAIIVRLLKLPIGTLIPEDIDQSAEWAREAIITVFSNGIMQGDLKNFEPNSIVTREMAVKIIVMLYEKEKL